MKCYWTVNSSYWPPLRVNQYEVNTSWPPQQVNSFTILKTKNQFILLCWKKTIKVYLHQLLDQPSQWQTSQQAGPCSVPKFTNTSITVKHLLIKNKNINQSKSSLLIWHYVSYLFLFIFDFSLLIFTIFMWALIFNMLTFSSCPYTGPGSSVDRVSAPGNGRSQVRSRATTYQSR